MSVTEHEAHLRKDNGEAVTLFPPDCHDEIKQTDMPIALNLLIRACKTDRRWINLLLKMFTLAQHSPLRD